MPNTTERLILIFLASCCILILGMMVFYPAGYDQAAFSIGGNLVRHGAVPYRDFLDTKPPIIFYIYALSSTIFGNHDWAIRVFDVLYQILAMVLFYKMLRKYGANRSLSITSVIIYITIYVGAGYWMTAQAETFALIPILLSINIALQFERNRASPIRAGLLLGLFGIFLFLLKYTLIIIPAGIIIWLFTRNGPSVSGKLKFSIATVAAVIGGIILYVLYLSVVGGLDTWKQSLTWLGGYSSIEPLLAPKVIIERYLKLFQMVIVEVFTLSMIACCAIGLYARYSRKEHLHLNALMSLCIVALSIGIIATLYERKLFHYHFLKFLWAFAPFAAIGVLEVAHRVALSWRSSSNVIKRGLLVGFVGIFLFYSPMLSLRQPFRWTYYRLAGVNEAEILDSKDGSFPLKEMQGLASELGPKLAETDNVFFWGNHVGVYTLLDRLPTTICLTNTPLSTSWTPQSWKEKLYKQLTDKTPHYVIIEKGDIYPFITGSQQDSRQRFFDDSFLSSFMKMNYDSLYGTAHFDVYKKNSAM